VLTKGALSQDGDYVFIIDKNNNFYTLSIEMLTKNISAVSNLNL
jgi:hypothetical protein